MGCWWDGVTQQKNGAFKDSKETSYIYIYIYCSIFFLGGSPPKNLKTAEQKPHVFFAMRKKRCGGETYFRNQTDLISPGRGLHGTGDFGVFFPGVWWMAEMVGPKVGNIPCCLLDVRCCFFLRIHLSFDRRISDTHTLVKKQTMAAVFVFLSLPGID